MNTNMQVKERPILFSGAMVRALLAGTKTQARRVVKIDASHLHIERPSYMGENWWQFQWASVNVSSRPAPKPWVKCPYGQPGDRLWVRETWMCPKQLGGSFVREKTKYRANYDEIRGYELSFIHGGWKPSIHMPRVLSRILLEITAVRCERLQDISESDAVAEGCEGYDDDVTGGQSAYSEYAELWKSINGPDSWSANPWVWVVEFKIINNL